MIKVFHLHNSQDVMMLVTLYRVHRIDAGAFNSEFTKMFDFISHEDNITFEVMIWCNFNGRKVQELR